MKSEMMKTSERRLIACKPAFEQRRQIGEGRARQARLLEQIVDEAQHLNPPAARGNRPLDAAAIEISRRRDCRAASTGAPSS